MTQKDEKNVNLTLDSGLGKKNDPTLAAWTTYAMERALWRGDKFKKEFPNEPTYRRTMREEADCLHSLVTVLTGTKISTRSKDVDPSRLPVVDIDQAGCIEAFALLNRADNEIAQDYVTDRTANRDQIFPLLRRIRGPASATTDGIPVTTSFVLPELPPSTQFLYQGSQNYPAETLQAVFLPGVHIQCL